ncbi:MAG: CoA transferase subunit A [Deltaproteobacteria bacterium]|nr:CoA transferase subunit A [Deltaproteobacteria bacterium]
MADKRRTLPEVVAELRDGMTIGIGGWGARRKPMALVRAILRSPLRDLTIVSYGGPDVGLLCAAGKVRKLVFGFVSLDLIPLDPHFRAARQAGALQVMELDEGMIQWGLRAAMLRLPFLPTRAGLATDVERLHPDLRTIASPYADGERLLAMPALPLDAALVHADHADARGNAQILGPDPYFDDLFCGAARTRYVTCERIVPTEDFAAHGCLHTLVLDRGMVDAVVEAPLGAHPTACTPAYGIDLEHLKAYGAATTPEGWADYRARFVDVDPAAYLAAVGGAERVRAIPPPIF